MKKATATLLMFVAFSYLVFAKKEDNMGKIIDLTGNKYGMLLVIKKTGVIGKGETLWLCKCDCGGVKEVPRGRLKSGSTKSCGCISMPHGKCGTSEYKTWNGMKERTTNPKSKQWKDYGGRGIFIEDPKWMDFKGFFEDMGMRPSKKHSLDRLDNNRGYSKSNCAWRTKKEQALNRRNNHLLHFNGESLTVSQWSEKLNVYDTLIHCRLSRGWSIEDALTKPIGHQNLPNSGRFSVGGRGKYPIKTETKTDG